MVGSRKVLSAVAALALAGTAAACSSSNKSSSTGPSRSSPPSSSAKAAPAGAPIKVGVVCSCTGAFGSQVSAGGDVAKDWAQSVNSSGGINGHPIQLTFDDDASNPGTSSSDAKALISDHVDVIFDLTLLDAVWAADAQAANIPVVGGNFTTEPFYKNPDFYASGQTNDSIAFAVATTAKSAGATTLSQLYCAEAPQCQQSVPLIKTAAQNQGIRNSYNASISATAPNYTAQCLAAKQAHANTVFIGDSPQVIARVGQDCSRQGYSPTYVTEGTGFNPLQSSAPGLKDNLWSPFPILPYYVNSPPVQKLNAVVDKYNPGMRSNTNVWSEYAAQAWTGGLLIEAAVKGGGLAPNDTPTSAEVVKGLTSLKGDTLDGWSPPLTFTAGQPHPIDCWFTGRVNKGATSLANGGKLTCHSGS